MQQVKNPNQSTVIRTVTVIIVLIIVAFAMSNSPAEATVTPGSNFSVYAGSTQEATNSGQSDATKELQNTKAPEKTSVPTETNTADETNIPDDKKITICHVPPGNVENAHTIT